MSLRRKPARPGRRRARRALAPTLLMALFLSPGAAHAADPAAGAALYASHCQSCHGADGRGRLAGTPDFRRDDALLQSDPALAAHIRDGRGVMPGFRGLLDGAEILDLIAYLRTLR